MSISPTHRVSLVPMMIGVVMAAAAVLFGLAAVQGQFGILRRVQIEAETQTLIDERTQLEGEVANLRNLTTRLSDEYLDLDLLDERARDVLGVLRADEVVVR